MSDAPRVACVMLVNGRHEMAARAVRAFEAQTHPNKHLVVLDTTPNGNGAFLCRRDALGAHVPQIAGRTIGSLRNFANGLCDSADIIAHFDSDDWSHPERIAEQVALLVETQRIGIQCVGYSQALFWDTRCRQSPPCPGGREGCIPRDEAWLYSNQDPRYVLGASMCYWRTAWLACQFDDAPHEDQRWWLKNANRCVGVSALAPPADPRMICGIHGDNTSRAYDKFQPPEWTPAGRYGSYCAERMKL